MGTLKTPTKLKKDNQLSEIVFHLKYISDFASDSVSSFKGIKKLENKIKDHVRFALFSRIVILSESFLDEFEFFSNFQNPVINETVLKIKKICHPAVKELQEWSDNRKFRNHILAHNFRFGKNNKSIFTNKRLDQYKIPKNEIELSFICELLIP